ncbi:MAG: Maf family nucleotide pyrophosphatase [Sediminibacterium sp.]
MQDFILASQSPRRKLLLEWAELPFEIIVRSTDETYPSEMPIAEVPIYIAKQKALAIQAHLQTAYHKEYIGKTILAADTIVVLDGVVIGKPKDRLEAISILTALSGKMHRVITGVVILHTKGEIAFSDITEVQFHPLTQDQIVFYVDQYAPYDKAGAYAIQEWIGVVGIASIKGDFYNVMGLPVSRVIQALNQLS